MYAETVSITFHLFIVTSQTVFTDEIVLSVPLFSSLHLLFALNGRVCISQKCDLVGFHCRVRNGLEENFKRSEIKREMLPSI